MAKRNGRYFRQMDSHKKQKKILETLYQGMSGVKVAVGDLQGIEEILKGYEDRLKLKLWTTCFACGFSFFLFFV